MAIQKKLIGRVPVNRGTYDERKTYFAQNIVQMYHSSFMSKIDNNHTAPAHLDERGFVVVNESWEIFADATNSENAAAKADKATQESIAATSAAKEATSDALAKAGLASTATTEANAARDGANKATQESAAATTAAIEQTALAKTATDAANTAAGKATTAATTIDAKINPVVESDKVQNERLTELESQVSDLKKYHGDDFCVSTYDKEQLAPEALEVKGNRAFALAWYPWLVDMTDNAGPVVTKAYTLKRNNWFRRASDGEFAPAVCISAEDWALCDAELYLDPEHTQKYCDSGAFDAIAFYNEHGMTQKLYNVDGSEVKHIRRPWETQNKDLSNFVGRKDTIRLCDNLTGRSGKILKGVFGSQTNYDGAQFGQFSLAPTGLAPSPVCTVGNKTRSFFYLMNGETNCAGGEGLGGCTNMFAPGNRTFPRSSDMHQMNDMKWSRANNATPESPVPFAEGGFHALNAFISCMEIGYGTKFLHDPEMFSSGISSNDSCSNEETWKNHGGVRLRKPGELEYRYLQWSSSPEMCYDRKGSKSNLSYMLSNYKSKIGVCEMQVAASYAVELGIPEGQEFELYGYTYWWKSVRGAKSLTEGEMNCRMYKKVNTLYHGFLSDGTPQDWEVEAVIRVGLMQGMDVSGDVFAYWGGGYEQIGHTIKEGNGTGFPIELYLQPDQSKWKNITAVTIADTEKFGVEDDYIHVGSTVNKGDSYTLTRCAYSGYPEKKGGSLRDGECFYSWNNNYWCSTAKKFCRIAARFRGSAYHGLCSQRALLAHYAVSYATADFAGSAQVMLGGAECNALQAQPGQAQPVVNA